MSGSAPYLIAGFILTWAVVALYAWRIEARLGDARDRVDRRGGGGPRVEAPDDGAAGGEAGREPETPAGEER